MAAETSIKLTYEDYLAIPDDGRRHEIIDGEQRYAPVDRGDLLTTPLLPDFRIRIADLFL